MLEARVFTVFTDHKPLSFAFSERKNNCSPRQFRHLDFISQFPHISGKDNVVADTLSRIEELQSPVDLEVLAESQASDSELSLLLSDNSTSLCFSKIAVPGCSSELYCDTSTGSARPFVKR